MTDEINPPLDAVTKHTGLSEESPLPKEEKERKRSVDELEHPLTERDKKRADIISRRNAELTATMLGEDPNGEVVTHPELAQRYNPEVKIQSEVAQQQNLEETPPDSATINEDSPPSQPLEDGGDDAQPYYLKDGVPTVALKVKGETIELPWERVKGIAQKNILAENRLRQAAEAERTLANREILISQREQELESKSLTLPPDAGVEDNVDLDQILDETATALFDGDKKDARATLARLMKAVRPTGQPPAFTAQQIKQQVEDTAKSVLREEKAADQEVRFKADLRDGLDQVSKQYPQVMQDDVLFSMVDRRTEDIAELHPDWPPQQVMLEAAKDIQARLTPEPDTPPVQESSERLARKEDLRVVPAHRISKTNEPPPEEAEPDLSPAAVIERMKADRGAIASR